MSGGLTAFCADLLRLLPAGAIAGWGLHPLESAAFARRTPKADFAHRAFYLARRHSRLLSTISKSTYAVGAKPRNAIIISVACLRRCIFHWADAKLVPNRCDRVGALEIWK